jgi:uncharacterized membrane protein YtjA (UPF0391 family)
MSLFSLVLLALTILSALFGFGFITGTRLLWAEIAFGVFLILFILSALSGFRPSEQLRIPWRGRQEP